MSILLLLIGVIFLCLIVSLIMGRNIYITISLTIIIMLLIGWYFVWLKNENTKIVRHEIVKVYKKNTKKLLDSHVDFDITCRSIILNLEIKCKGVLCFKVKGLKDLKITKENNIIPCVIKSDKDIQFCECKLVSYKKHLILKILDKNGQQIKTKRNVVIYIKYCLKNTSNQEDEPINNNEQICNSEAKPNNDDITNHEDSSIEDYDYYDYSENNDTDDTYAIDFQNSFQSVSRPNNLDDIIPNDGVTSLPINPVTSLPINPDTSNPINPDTSNPINPDTSNPINPDTSNPINVDTSTSSSDCGCLCSSSDSCNSCQSCEDSHSIYNFNKYIL